MSLSDGINVGTVSQRPTAADSGTTDTDTNPAPGLSASPAGDAIPSTRLGIRDLRAQLTALVRRAGTGERVVVTIAGRPVAQLGPVEPAGGRPTLDDLVARGLIEPARRGDRPEPDVVIDSWTGGRLDRALREVRGA